MDAAIATVILKSKVRQSKKIPMIMMAKRSYFPFDIK